MARKTGALAPWRVRAMARRQRAIKMRERGYSFERIARALGRASRASAWHCVNYELKRMANANAETLRKVAGERLEEIVKGLWPTVLAGDLPSIKALIRVLEQQAKLFGLDAPEFVVSPTAPATEVPRRRILHVDGGELTESLEQSQQLLDSLGSGSGSPPE